MQQTERKSRPLPPVVQANLNISFEMPQVYGKRTPVKEKFEIVIVVITLALFLGCFLIVQSIPYVAFTLMDRVPMGNTYANLTSDAFVAESEDWLYLADNPEGAAGLYKVNKDTMAVTLLSEGSIRSVNVLGGWVYYIAGYGRKTNLYKVPTDGGSPVLLAEGCIHAQVVGDWIYFDCYTGVIKKIKTNGTKEKVLVTHVTSLFYVRRIDVYGIKEFTTYNFILTSGLNGDTYPTLSNIKSPVSDGDIHYACMLEDQPYTPLIVINNRDEETFRLMDLRCSLPFPVEDRAYINCEDGIYRINKDGTGKTKISEDHYTAINQAGDFLLFRSEQTGKLMKMNLDGSDITPFWGE